MSRPLERVTIQDTTLQRNTNGPPGVAVMLHFADQSAVNIPCDSPEQARLFADGINRHLSPNTALMYETDRCVEHGLTLAEHGPFRIDPHEAEDLARAEDTLRDMYANGMPAGAWTLPPDEAGVIPFVAHDVGGMKHVPTYEPAMVGELGPERIEPSDQGPMLGRWFVRRDWGFEMVDHRRTIRLAVFAGAGVGLFFGAGFGWLVHG